MTQNSKGGGGGYGERDSRERKKKEKEKEAEKQMKTEVQGPGIQIVPGKESITREYPIVEKMNGQAASRNAFLQRTNQRAQNLSRLRAPTRVVHRTANVGSVLPKN